MSLLSTGTAVAEVALGGYVGHLPGVALGVSSLLLNTVFKSLPNDIALLQPVAAGVNTFTIVLLLVRLATLFPDQRYLTSFPDNVAHSSGCTRIAPTRKNKDYGLQVPKFNASVDEVQRTVRSWILSQPRSKIFFEEPGYLYAQSLSFLFGFPDNVGVKIFKGSDGKTEVWVQSELRVGEGDLEVNYKRVKALVEHLDQKLK